MLINATAEYKDALAALDRLQENFGRSPEVKAIALFLLFSSQCEAKERPYAWQPVKSEKDKSFIRACEEFMDLIIRGEDVD